jgi:hypothetical protein
MKKIQIKGKLSLNKTTISSLNHPQMHNIKGGANGNEAILCTLLWCFSKKCTIGPVNCPGVTE